MNKVINSILALFMIALAFVFAKDITVFDKTGLTSLTSCDKDLLADNGDVTGTGGGSGNQKSIG